MRRVRIPHMPQIAKWRGEPDATTSKEAERIFKLAKLSKNDVFYDLGCGHGWVCIWAARHCKAAKGIEDLKLLVNRAKRNVAEAGVKNVEIIRGNFFDNPLTEATMLFCIVGLNTQDFEMWTRNRRHFRIVTLGPPPVPILPAATADNYCLTQFPYRKAKRIEEWYEAVVGKRSAKWIDVRKKYDCLNGEALRVHSRALKRAFGKTCLIDKPRATRV